MFNILKKELKDSFRDQRTLLLTVFLPLILMSALVFFYEKMLSPNEDEIYPVAVKEEQSAFLKQLLTSYNNIDLIIVEDIRESVDAGDVVAAVDFEKTFEQKITNNESPTVQIYGDTNSLSSAIAINTIEAAFNQFSQSIVAENLQSNNVDPTILSPFIIEHTQVVEGDNAVGMIAFLIPLMLSIAVGVGITPAATDLIAGEKERKTMEALLMTPVNRSALLLAKWFTMVIIATFTGLITLIIVFIEVQFFTETIKAGLNLGDNAWIIVLTAFLVVISYAALLASALMITSISAKTIKEAQSYSSPITMIAMLPAMFLVNLGVNELTTTHFIIPVVNIFTIFKELFFGVINVEHITLTVFSNLIIAFVIFFVGRIMFLKDKWVLAS
jgi:sodium transport system permease protein